MTREGGTATCNQWAANHWAACLCMRLRPKEGAGTSASYTKKGTPRHGLVAANAGQSRGCSTESCLVVHSSMLHAVACGGSAWHTLAKMHTEGGKPTSVRVGKGSGCHLTAMNSHANKVYTHKQSLHAPSGLMAQCVSVMMQQSRLHR